MSAFSFFSPNGPRKAPAGSRRKNTSLRVESLEDRSLPSGIVISGYVFSDPNNTGIMAPGDTGIADNSVELKNAGGQVVGTATTDTTGYYQFNTDSSVNQTPLTETETLNLGPTPTDFDLQGLVNQFNPALGTLEEIDVTHAGSITSDIQVQNTSTTSPSTINGNVSGNLTLTGPGINDKLALSQYAGTFNAPAGDGDISFQGASSNDFGQKTANGSDNVTLTGAQLTPFIGTGQVQLSENGQATSNATGGGNIAVKVASTGQATITVVYKYVPSNSIQPGNYTIVETQEPPGYFPGKNSSNGVVLNNPPGDEQIPVTVTTNNVPNNDFGKLQAATLAGTVYYDANDNGTFDSGDQGLTGVSLQLSGTTTASNTPVTQTVTTDANGNYQFTNLQAGNYTITETPPSGYLDGTITAGSSGGTVGTNTIGSIQLPAATNATSYDFGELKGASLAGFVYVDQNSDGTMDPGDPGIGTVTLTVTGTASNGNQVSTTAVTDSTGAYSFNSLSPGNYTITETPPANYLNGTADPGNLGGTAGTDVISAIQVGMGQAGTQYNFGEKVPPNADLGIVKTASAPISAYGSQLTYTLAVTNYGPVSAQNVLVTDTLPAGETFVTGTGTGWTVTDNGSTVTATMPSMANGATSDVTLVVTVPSVNSHLTNTATVTSNTPDNNPSNNTSTITTLVQGPGGNIQQQGNPINVGLPLVSKLQLITGGLDYLDPTIRAQAAFVGALYSTLQNASGTTVAGTEQTRALLNGSLTAQQLVGQLWNSPQHYAVVTQQLYQQYLGRNPTAAEETTMVNALVGGATIQSQAATILTSPAFQALHPSSDQLAYSLYQNVTGTAPDGNTQTQLAQSMGSETLGQFITSLQTSQAGVNQALTQTFESTLRRAPTAAETARYGPQLTAGTLTTDQLAQKLLASQEFVQLALHSVS